MARIRARPPINMAREMHRNRSQLENDPTAIFGSLIIVSMPPRRSSLAESFEEDDPSGDGNV